MLNNYQPVLTNAKSVGSYVKMYPLEYVLPRLYRAYRLIKGKHSYWTWLRSVREITVHYSMSKVMIKSDMGCELRFNVICDVSEDTDARKNIPYFITLSPETTYHMEVFTNNRGYCCINALGFCGTGDFFESSPIALSTAHDCGSVHTLRWVSRLGVELHAPVSSERINFVLRVERKNGRLQSEWR